MNLPPGGPGLPAEPSGLDLPSAMYGPVGGPRDRRSSPLHPGQRDPGQLRVPTEQAAPREGINDATKAPPSKVTGGIGLQAKLDARRAAEMEQGLAMKPFRNGAPAAPVSDAADGRLPVASGDIPTELIEEEDLDLQSGTKSPGLDGLG